LQIGTEALSGVVGAAKWKYRLGNTLSGRRPSVPISALSLMCVARRRGRFVTGCLCRARIELG